MPRTGYTSGIQQGILLTYLSVLVFTGGFIVSLFIDRAGFTAKAGNGGNGCVSFHREKFVLNGGPDGGDGGKGGNIVLLADENLHTLLDFRYRTKYYAEDGEGGSGGRCTGKAGAGLTIRLPVGTIVRNKATNAIVADMYTPGQQRILLHGGRGGWGNQHFATSTRQAPNFAKPGVKTVAHEFLLELKTIADVGLVGYPNVGKSTILSVVSAARPKIANYHFTTLSPNLGMVRHKGIDFVMADIPGLVEGASAGAGLGHEFLRHVERTRLLLHVLDISGSEGRDPLADYAQINHELAQYGGLASRPQIIIANKTDLPEAVDNLHSLTAALPGITVFPVSAVMKKGFEALLDAIILKLKELPPAVPFAVEDEWEDIIDLGSFHVEKSGPVYIVSGPSMEHLLSSVNFDDEESMNWFHATLHRTGVIEELRKAGAVEGDTVRIIDMEFDFVD